MSYKDSRDSSQVNVLKMFAKCFSKSLKWSEQNPEIICCFDLFGLFFREKNYYTHNHGKGTISIKISPFQDKGAKLKALLKVKTKLEC